MTLLMMPNQFSLSVTVRGARNIFVPCLASALSMRMDLWSPWSTGPRSRELTLAEWSFIPDWLAGLSRNAGGNTVMISGDMTRMTGLTGREWVDMSGLWLLRIFPTPSRGVSWPEPRPTVQSPSHADCACWRNTSSCSSPTEPHWMWNQNSFQAVSIKRSYF